MLVGPKSSLSELVSRQLAGYSLERRFYVDEDIFESDVLELSKSQWLFVDHVSRIPQRGDFITCDIFGESIILIRAERDEIHAFYNVCRHRGSRVCTRPEGHATRLVCPYHAWTYDLEGRLISAKHMPNGFDATHFSLASCPVRVFEGLIFVNLGSNAAFADFDLISRNLLPFVVQHGIERAKIAHRGEYPTEGNWKLVVENFRECYHCAPAHPEYTSVEAHVRANSANPGSYAAVTADWESKVGALGHIVGSFDWSSDCPSQPHKAFRRPIRPGWMTHSRDGKPLAPLMGNFRDFDGGQTVMFFGPLFSIIALNDHAILFNFRPKTPRHTEVTLTWLVNEAAKAGIDYNIGDLTWLWDVTTVQDATIIGNNQKGVNSHKYVPGPYSEWEGETCAFTKWYLDLIGDRPLGA
jgi:Rieske 2Fe-2S family protein